MANHKTKLELTWIGEENQPRLEPRILIEDPEKSYHAPFQVGDKDLFDNRLIFGDNLTVDRPGVLASVSATISSAETNISHADITTTEDRKAVLKFVADIKDLSHLERLLQKIEQVDGVLSAKRLMGS